MNHERASVAPSAVALGGRADPLVKVDFAYVSAHQLLVYGWVFEFGRNVAGATIHLGAQSLDLTAEGVLIRRPDVTRHFGTNIADSDEHHGFFMLAELPEPVGDIDHFNLELVDPAGRRNVTQWPVVGETGLAEALRSRRATLAALVRQLPEGDAQRLLDFAKPALALEDEPLPAELPAQVRFVIDRCSVLQNHLLFVFGWLLDPDDAITALEFEVGSRRFDLRAGMTRVVRPDLDTHVPNYGSDGQPPRHGFVFVAPLPDGAPVAERGRVLLSIGPERLVLPQKIVLNPREAGDAFFALLEAIDPGVAVALIERVGGHWASGAETRRPQWLAPFAQRALARLPKYAESDRPRYLLHLDSVLRVPGGLFLVGWCAAERGAELVVTCHAGAERVDLEKIWVRCARPDVLGERAAEEVAWETDKFGFLSFVPLGDTDAPCYLRVASGDRFAYVRLAAAPRNADALRSVCSILTAFGDTHAELRTLLDRHVGPTVGAVWAARAQPSLSPRLSRFGAPTSKPEVSIIVPLYGRHDLAEYQLALFADDPDIAANELIYVVDDPTIADAFLARCPDLYALYGVPFAVAVPGVNLGFAGANNYGARLASGSYLLLLNSDVFPKAPGWLDRLVDLQASMPDTGILGTKLLYEDGSVQHAGMEFRRYHAWDGLWINHHPYKGQSATGLTGVREVDAVTAACALIETSLYRQVGGLSEDYIIGDFEDSDLCLRVAETGRRNRVALDIELYHLERQSQGRIGSNHWRTNLTLYNCWLYNHRWGGWISEHRG